MGAGQACLSREEMVPGQSIEGTLGGIMGARATANELRLSWSARGLAYLLGKHGLEELIPLAAPRDGSARVELRVVGAEVKEMRWMGTGGSARRAPGTRGR